MQRFALEQVTNRLARLAFEVRNATKSHTPASVHALRVSSRRLTEGLRVFSQFFPRRETRRIRRRLRRLLRLAGAVRNHDIALLHLERAGVSHRTALRTRVAEERKASERELAVLLRRWSRHAFSARWRVRLRLSAE
jgi:CHAD domain-containing protein